MEVAIVTSNPHKVRETRKIAEPFGIELKHVDLDVPEVRGTLQDVVQDKARRSFAEAGEPVICDDSGFFIDALDSFPGPFSAFVFKRLGCEGILKLMRGEKERGAEFRCAAAYHDGKRMLVRLGIVRGTVTREPAGSGGFGYDPIFQPDGHRKTFAEDVKHKMRISHRREAFTELFAELAQQAEDEEVEDEGEE